MVFRFRLLILAVAITGLAGCDSEAPPAAGAPEGMVMIPGGTFRMGSPGVIQTAFGPKEYPEETPVQEKTVAAFWMDATEVTNRQFAEFVAATGYVTFAERELDPESLPPEARAELPEGAKQGALVFLQPGPDDPAEDYQDWWKWDPQANWRRPFGENSSIDGKQDHPVVCVTLEDAQAFADWAGKRIPTEVEWEFAARGGLDGAIYTWGNEFKSGSDWMANSWQGDFPKENTADDGHVLTAPTKTYPANGFGLYDMGGNVWELCVRGDTNYRIEFSPTATPTRGGSYLCHISYCMRYRPAARQSQEPDSPTCHTGFRCVRSIPASGSR